MFQTVVIVVTAWTVGMGATWTAPVAGGDSAPVTKSVVGTLASYDVRTRTLAVSTQNGRRVFILADKASVRQGSKVLGAGDLPAHAGLKVKVRYTEEGGQHIAQSVMLASSS